MSAYACVFSLRGHRLSGVLLALLIAGQVGAARADDGFAPLGTAQVVQRQYPAIDTVVDVSYQNPKDLNLLYGTLRSIRQSLPQGRVVVVVHGPELRAFAKDDYDTYQGEMQRMVELAEAGVEFRMCHEALRVAGFEADDMHGFVTVVPNGYAEVALLQQQGHQLIVPQPHDVRDLRQRVPANELPG